MPTLCGFAPLREIPSNGPLDMAISDVMLATGPQAAYADIGFE